MKTKFELIGFFEATLDQMAPWLKGTGHPLEMSVRNGNQQVVIALPFGLSAMSMYSEDHNLEGNGSGGKAIKEADSMKEKIKTGISGKYATFKVPGKFVSTVQYAEGVEYTDKAIVMVVEEVTNRNIRFESGQNYEVKWLRIAYLTTEGGVFSPAKVSDEFAALIKSLKAKYESTHPLQEKKAAPVLF